MRSAIFAYDLASTGYPIRAFDFSQGTEEKPQVLRFALGGASSDAEQIITALARFALEYGRNPIVINFARGLLPATLRQNDRREQLATVLAFVRQRLRYVADPQGIEYVVSPIRILRNICADGFSTGDCDDHVLFVNSMLNSMGFETWITAVMVNGEQEHFNHVISTIATPAGMLDIDLCRPDKNYFKTYPGRRLSIKSS